ncbi:D-2-hydroxyacid dehydrogenase [Halobacteriales archaeon QS_8_69_26]|nr:MAG: D-2-hydroxyacid dehydrogenase [Halobacteriales archaeon QS_8_69_26]
MELSRIGVHESVGEVFPPERLVEALSDLDRDVAVVGTGDLADYDAVVTFEYDDAFADPVAWIHSIQAGVDRFPFETLEERGVALTNSTGIHGESVGEMVVGYMIALARQFPQYVRNQRDHAWRRPAWDRPFTLDGESICVVGLGTLGRGIATRAAALGMSVTGVRRSGDPVEGVETVHPPGDLLAAVRDARFVALAVPLTDETRDLVGARELAAMDDDAYLINVARGPVVDEDALVEALREGEIAGAALDVFETEPLPASSPLWDREDVVVTPHVAATVRSYYEDVADLVRENVRRVDDGEEIINRVV